MSFDPYGALGASCKALVLLLCLFWGQKSAAEEVVVVTLGDSLTAGYGLAPADGFAAQLQNWLDERQVNARIVNASVSGDTTAGGLARVGWVLTPDTDAVVVQLGANDFLRGLPPGDAMANLDGIMAQITGRDLPVLLVGMPAPSNYGAQYKADFDAIYPTLANRYEADLYPDFFNAFRSLDVSRASEVLQRDGLHPNPEGVARIVADIGPSIAKLVSTVDASSLVPAN